MSQSKSCGKMEEMSENKETVSMGPLDVFFKHVDARKASILDDEVLLGKRGMGDTSFDSMDQAGIPTKFMFEQNHLSSEDVERELLGDQFDDIDTMLKATEPNVADFLPKDFKWVDEDWERGEFKFDPIPDCLLHAEMYHAERMESFLSGVKDSNMSNPYGFHLMFGYQFIDSWNIDKRDYPGVAVVWGGDMDSLAEFDSHQFRTISKKMPMFLGYLSSNSGLRNYIIQTMTDAGADIKSLPQQSIINSDSSFYWSLEGWKEYKKTGDRNKLHYHVVALYPKTITSERAGRVISYVEASLPKVTIRALRSSKQLRYIFKERFMYGCSWNSEMHGVFNAPRDVAEILIDNSSKTLAYFPCSICSSVSTNDRFSAGEMFGWDLAVIEGVAVTAPFTTAFKNIAEYKTWVETRSTEVDFCISRLRNSVAWRSKMLLSCLLAIGLSAVQARKAFIRIGELFDQFIRVGGASRTFKTLNEWIRMNLKHDAMNSQTFKVVLALGGWGGVGKTTLAQCLHRGAAMPFEQLQFARGGAIGRGNYGGYSLIRFYDEVVGGVNQRDNIFSRFVQFEEPEKRLFKSNCLPLGVQFTIAASATITSLPTEKEFLAIEGMKSAFNGTVKREYAKYLSQAKRRFKFLTLTDDIFLTPYMKFFKASDYTSPLAKTFERPQFVMYV